MNIATQVRAVLQNAKLAVPLAGDFSLEQVQGNAYCLHNGDQSLFIKWISDDDRYGANEIWVNQQFLRQIPLVVPRFIGAWPTAGATVAAWEWLDGIDLRTVRRDLLPDAFAALGHFHASQRQAGPVYSPTNHQRYETIDALLQGELHFLCSHLDKPVEQECAPFFVRLQAGYGALIHGDMHPGNLRFADERLYFVDWGYARCSLNLFDLDYCQSVRFPQQDELPWWIVSPQEAEAVLPAYFAACGLAQLEVAPIHRAVMLWNELRSHYHSVLNQNQEEIVTCRRRIDWLLGTNL
jgi:Ser/Thr protein kinase RdoA (MazF antagonist)